MGTFVFLLALTPLWTDLRRAFILPPRESLPSKYDSQDDSFEVDPPVQSVPVESLSNLTMYRGPLPNLPVTTVSPWVALHSPVKMYIPIRYSDSSAANSPRCVRCPRNLIAHLRRGQGRIQTPVPTISICPRFASQPGRVHVAVMSGPRPGQRLSLGRYKVDLVVWKAHGPVHSCRYTITVKGKHSGQTSRNIERLSCGRPYEPRGGVVVCDHDKKRRRLPHNSVCQLFCLGHNQNTSANNTITVCEDGQWLPETNWTCSISSCRAPNPVEHGTWDCEHDDPLEGSLCRLRCDVSRVVPSSQLKEAVLRCADSGWNASASGSPQCKRARPPSLRHCLDRKAVVRTGFQFKLDSQYLPEGVTPDGRSLVPVCTLQEMDLPAGNHLNYCQVIDPELRTEANCSHSVLVEESSDPVPHADDCQNQTVLRNYSISTRFVVKIGIPSRTVMLTSNCTPNGEDISLGVHLIRCEATYPVTNATGSCSFWLSVEDVQPTLVQGCEDLTITAPSSINVIAPLPLFHTLNNDTVNVSCSPTHIRTLGQHQIQCLTDFGNVTCSYNIKVVSDQQSVGGLKKSSTTDGHSLTTATEGSAPTSTHQPLSTSSAKVVPTRMELLSTRTTERTSGWFSKKNFTKSSTPSTQPICESSSQEVSTRELSIARVTSTQPVSVEGNSSSTTMSYTEIDSTENRTTTSSSETRTSLTQTTKETSTCPSLEAPLNGQLVCSREGAFEQCLVTCDSGYGRPGSMDPLVMTCKDGVWDFRVEDAAAVLPPCLAQMDSSAVQVWMGFEATAPSCEEDTEKEIENVIANLCPPGTECLNTVVNCTLDEEGDIVVLSVRWTVQADFEDPGEDEEEVPEAETRLEAALELGRSFVVSGDMLGVQLRSDSFRRGLISLVCPEGFTADMMAANCVRCPPSVTEMSVQCLPCGCDDF